MRRAVVAVALAALLIMVVAPAGANHWGGCGLLGWSSCPHRVKPPPSPDPGGDERANLPVPPPGGKRFGFSDNVWQTRGRENPGITAEAMGNWTRAAGANAARIQLEWRAAEPRRDRWATEPGGYLERFAQGYAALVARGVRPLITLAFAPSWAADPLANLECGTRPNCLRAPDDSRRALDEWAEFAGSAAARFPHADFEIWNEPNAAEFFRPEPSPARYVRLLVRAHHAIKARNRDARVLAGALSQGARHPEDITSWAFVDGMADAGLSRQYDALSWHVYPHVRGHAIDGIGAGSEFAQDWERFRRAVAAHDPGARIWVTETGVTTTGTSTTDPTAQTAVSPEAQRDWIGRLYDKLLTMPDVDAVFVHQLFERTTYPPWARGRGFGLVTPGAPPTAKPALCELRRRAGAPGYVPGC